MNRVGSIFSASPKLAFRGGKMMFSSSAFLGKSKAALLWVTFEKVQPFKVDTSALEDVSELAKIVKAELTPLTDPFAAAELLIYKPDGSRAKANDTLFSLLEMASFESPVHITAPPPPPPPPPTKTVFIQDVDDEMNPIDKFKKAIVENDEDVKGILEGKGSALINMSDYSERVTRFKRLVDGEKYCLYSAYRQSMQ